MLLPLALAVALEAGFLEIANEPLAYRFFYSERIFSGDFVVVGVGYFVSLLHHLVYAIIASTTPSGLSGLESRLNAFAIGTNAALTAALIAVLVAGIRAKSLTPADQLLLGLSAIVPLYGTLGIGFDYALMADYTYLNIGLATATLLLFQLSWRGGWEGMKHVVLLGSFAGLSAANKITFVAVGILPVASVVFRRSRTPLEFAKLSAVAVLSSTLCFVLVHWLSYLGQFHAVVRAAMTWFSFVGNPGQEPAFWEAVFPTLLNGGYVAFWGVFVVSATVGALTILDRPERLRELLAVLVLIGCSVLASTWFILKRPAQSTLFESSMFVLVASCAALTAAYGGVHIARIRATILLVSACLLGLAITTFPFATRYDAISVSGANSREKWQAFNLVLQLSEGSPVEVVLPNNSYHHEGVFELLLKGASTFPSWSIGSGRRFVLDRYDLPIRFRHDHTTPSPNDPYRAESTVVWFQRSGDDPLPAKLPSLAAAISKQGVKVHEWTLPMSHWADPTRDPPRFIKMGVAKLPGENR